MEEQAKKVSLYLECSTTALGKKERMCGYVLEYITEKGPATLVNYRNRLADWAAEDFMSNGKPIVNREEWRRIWEQIQKHQVNIELGEHAYSRWLLTEMEEKCRNYQRTKC